MIELEWLPACGKPLLWAVIWNLHTNLLLFCDDVITRDPLVEKCLIVFVFLFCYVSSNLNFNSHCPTCFSLAAYDSLFASWGPPFFEIWRVMLSMQAKPKVLKPNDVCLHEHICRPHPLTISLSFDSRSKFHLHLTLLNCAVQLFICCTFLKLKVCDSTSKASTILFWNTEVETLLNNLNGNFQLACYICQPKKQRVAIIAHNGARLAVRPIKLNNDWTRMAAGLRQACVGRPLLLLR